MRLNLNKGSILKLSIFIFALLFIVMIVSYWNRAYTIFYPFLISIIGAYLLNPLVCKMEQKGIRRTIGILIIYTVLMATFIYTCFYLIPVVIRDLGKLVGVLPEYNEKFRLTVQYFQDRWSEAGLPQSIKSVIDNNITRVQDYLTESIATLISIIVLYLSKFFSFVLIPILLYYFLKDFNKITEEIKMLIPRKYRNHVVRVCSNIDEVFGSYIRSQIILSLIIAVMTTLALIILKIDFAVVIGIFNGIVNIIPYFGPIIGMVPAVLIALLQSPLKAFYTLIIFIVIQQIESDFISPKITGDSVGLHPVTVILSLIIGGELFGIPGMIFGVPLTAALKIIYCDIMKSLF